MNVYLQAAQAIARNHYWFSCAAVKNCGGDDALYERMFWPKNRPSDWCWLEGQFKTPEEDTEWRLTALCFAAAMHDTGDL